MKKISVLLVDDHIVVREGLRMLLEKGTLKLSVTPRPEVKAVDKTRQLHPDVVVMDIAMPLQNGLQATREILRRAPETRVLVLSAHADPEYVEQVACLGEQAI